VIRPSTTAGPGAFTLLIGGEPASDAFLRSGERATRTCVLDPARGPWREVCRTPVVLVGGAEVGVSIDLGAGTPECREPVWPPPT
jgi:hypothetical protein